MGEASGYEIKKIFEGPFAAFHHAGYGSIYPALAKLTEDGLVTCAEKEQVGRPHKKVYEMTEKGIKTLKAALARKPAVDKVRSESMVMFFFADLMEEDRLKDVFDSYLRHYKENLEFLRGLDPSAIPPGRMFARGFGAAFYEAAISYMEKNRGLLFDRNKEERAE
ncbi:MAG TPA: PadR family transcriptional regulator [Rhodospirillales bacterium]|nr:PadR family transcriptional regulator [Rhodospirillales bacterium]